ncbi:MAG: hypothetical protein HKL83_05640 [Acidimicrobiaceae bacterium]|nr:hypothetical protein [Acidimicrobiaceae bacterium]
MARWIRLALELVISGFVLAGALLLLVPAFRNVSVFYESGTLSQPVYLRPLAVPTVFLDRNGQKLYTLGNGQFRSPVTLNQVPKTTVRAILDVEDHTFYQHGAIDLRSIGRAIVVDATGGAGLQGASTITQQLVKQEVLTPQRTLSRKIKEVFIAFRLTHQLSKNQILQDYLNTVYFGEGAYGIQAAAETYFGEGVSHLDTAQSALLAALIEDPSGLDPFYNPSGAKFRRNLALKQMMEYGDLTKAEYLLAIKQPLPTVSHRTLPGVPSAFVAEVIRRLETEPRYSFLGSTPTQRYQQLLVGGYTIHTTLDSTMQGYAEQAVKDRMPNTNGKFEAALVSVDPSNGQVRTLVSGNPASGAGGYDVVTGVGGTGRQPGSSFKPFVLMAALQQGYSPYDTIDGTAPCTFTVPNTKPYPYVANNAEPGFGLVSILKATADSINCAYIRLGINTGLTNVVSMAHLLGVKSPLVPLPSMSIGSEDVNPLEMADAYATIDDYGVYHAPQFITSVDGSNGQVLIQRTNPGIRVASSQDAKVTIAVMEHVITQGTGTAAQLGRPAAGKTGTTDNFTDAWFNGFTPQLVTAVWMGDPAGSVPMFDVGGIPVYGGTYPTEIWHEFMAKAMANQAPLNFKPPNLALIPPGKLIVPIDAPGSIIAADGTRSAPYGSSGNSVVPPTTTTTVPPTTTVPSTTTSTIPGSTTTTTGTTSTTASVPTTTVPPTTAVPLVPG